jgi:hypothetical protein
MTGFHTENKQNKKEVAMNHGDLFYYEVELSFSI